VGETPGLGGGQALAKARGSSAPAQVIFQSTKISNTTIFK
jgi:hypothetical protein